MDHRELHHGEEVDGEFLEPRADPMAFLQPADRLLDDAAAFVGLLVEDGSAVVPLACFGNPDPVGMKVNYPFREETFNDDETTEEASS